MSTSKSVNPKLVISQYYDSLICEIDKFTEVQLNRFSEDELIDLSMKKKIPKSKIDFNLDSFNSDSFFDEPEEKQKSLVPNLNDYLYGFDVNSNIIRKDDHQKSPAMKVHDYYNRAREEMITELSKLQEEAFTRYNNIKGEIKGDNTQMSEENQLEMLRAQLFAHKFAFVVEYEFKEAKDDEEDDDDEDEDEEEEEDEEDETKRKLKLCHLVILDFYLNENARRLFMLFLVMYQQFSHYWNFKLDFNYGNISIESKDDLKFEEDGLLIYYFSKYIEDLFCTHDLVRNIVRIEKQFMSSAMANKFLDLSFWECIPYCFCFSEFKIPPHIKMLSVDKISFASKSFEKLCQLRRLCLNKCDFSNMASNVFNHLVNLDFLSIALCSEFSHIQFNELPCLKRFRLFVAGNDNVPAFQNINTNLKELTFVQVTQDLPIKSTKDVFQECCFSNLESLTLNGNKDEFDLECLREKCQSKNEATGETISTLEYLVLRKFKVIKGSFSSLPNLQTLILSSNDSLVYTAGMFKGLENLKLLEINIFDETKLTPDVFDGLDKLLKLTLAISSINKELFSHLSHLNELDLSDFSEIDKDAFYYLGRLQYLDLNNISNKIPDGLFLPLQRLKRLRLNFENNHGITRNTLEGLKNLRELKIIGTKDIQIEAFSNMPYLERIVLGEDCDDQLIKSLKNKYPKITFKLEK